MLSKLTGYQKELLAHIEFMGRFYGVVSRADLTSRFEISDASATRTFRIYNELAPDNIIYRPNIKRYEWQEGAQPIIPVSTAKCVSTLTDGFGDSFAHIEGQAIAIKNSLFNVDLNILSAVTRAIRRNQVISISYLSKSNPDGSTRDIVPHSIADSGLRWHVRAFDRKRNQFIDFVINRILSVTKSTSQIISSEEKAKADDDWNTFVELEIQPHPRLQGSTNVIAHEYRMEDNLLCKRVRRALAGYLLDSWNIDVSVDALLNGDHIMLHLRNTSTVHFPNKHLAPGGVPDST
ncbi:WYL domain-containing protein [Pseudidiomarina planktonica]|uniref:WYL domain-containing protein n=2 Tax=Pseudidiomarina planktonica TaxID=1323738 RepID=A0A1Y6E9T5_9GAMM|nr:WYL domain-containing protein [Pseudidiomarina planktonica]SMQ59354.1 WYL domain-containing protein [Pseudidiomarina planktonica]